MNITAIILGITIVILIYVLYKYFSVSASTLMPTASLKASNPAITSINSPTNTRYAYGIWVYINSWDVNTDKTIFSRAGNIKLHLDKNTPTLRCKITLSTGAVSDVMVTNDFPLQKWVCITVSVDNQFVDIYIDGKLVVSQKISTMSSGVETLPATPPDKDVPVMLGVGMDANVANFQRWTAPVDPQTAWTTYMGGNGSSSLTSSTGTYGANLSILKNNIETNTIKLL